MAEKKMKKIRQPKPDTPALSALKFFPLLVFALLIIVGGLELVTAAAVSVFVALAVAMYTTGRDYNTLYHTGLDAAARIIEVYFIVQFANALAECFMATGVGAAVINIALQLGVTARSVGIIALVVTCVLSVATGTSWGTFAACAPIFLWLNYIIGGNMILTIGACAGGACFGDNIGVISDTTVLSCGMQDVKIIDRVKHQLGWSGLCLVASSIIIYMLSLNLTNTAGNVREAFSSIPEETFEVLAEERPAALALLQQVQNGVPYYMVIPLILVIVIAFMGVSTLMTLGTGMVACLIFGYIAGTCDISTWLNDLVTGGMSASGGSNVIMMMWVSMFGGLMNSMNAFEPLSKLIIRISKNVNQLMSWCGVLCMIGNAALADEACEIATISPIVRNIVEENVETADEESMYRLRTRLATYTDALGVMGSELIPWHCYIVFFCTIASSVFPLHVFTPGDLIKGNIMSFVMVGSMLVLSFTGLDRFIPGFALPGKDKAWLKKRDTDAEAASA